MNNIPPKLRDKLAQDPFYAVCSMRHLEGHICKGKVTWEHSIIFAGKQLQERWAIIPLCEYGHAVNSYQDGPGLNKRKNQWVATQRATVDELKAISKAENYLRTARILQSEFGTYSEAECLAWKPTAPEVTNLKQDDQKKLAWNDKRREMYWLALHDHTLRQLIQDEIDYARIYEGLHYSPQEMVYKMITAYHKETGELKATQGMIDTFVGEDKQDRS